MSPDVPFVFREGQDQVTALHNRIAALKRIEFLCGVDLSRKSDDYKMLVDSIMFERWYKDYPSNHRINDEWCQRAAEVTRELEAKDKKDLTALESTSRETVKTLYDESRKRIETPTDIPITPKWSLFKRALKLLGMKHGS